MPFLVGRAVMPRSASKCRASGRRRHPAGARTRRPPAARAIPPRHHRQPRARQVHELGLQREVDDVADLRGGLHERRWHRYAGCPSMPTGVVLTRPSSVVEGAGEVGGDGDPVVAVPLGQAHGAYGHGRRRRRDDGDVLGALVEQVSPPRRRRHRADQHDPVWTGPAAPRGSAPVADQSVLRPSRRPSRNTTVLTAPRSAASSESLSRSGSTACLKGWVMLTPVEAEALGPVEQVRQVVGARPSRAASMIR